MTHVADQLADRVARAADVAADGERLDREEDARLRLLTALSAFGELSDSADGVRSALRQRDRRAVVREPEGFTVEPVAAAAEKFLHARLEPVAAVPRAGTAEQRNTG